MGARRCTYVTSVVRTRTFPGRNLHLSFLLSFLFDFSFFYLVELDFAYGNALDLDFSVSLKSWSGNVMIVQREILDEKCGLKI